jgi:prepilin-type N-terminal cleavage/methylation domain-containing protein
MKNNNGFTLVETAVVLVIIGLILGGILGSRSLIRSMQAKDVIAIVEDLRAATVYFKQRRSYLPGDFPVSANGEIPNISTPGGNGNGAINGTINAQGQANAGSEVEAASWHLYNDGFINKIDNTDPRRRLRTLYGAAHLIITANSGVAAYAAANPTVRNVIVFTNLPRDLVEEVDSKIDNGDRTTGRAIGNAPNASDVIDRYAIALE